MEAINTDSIQKTLLLSTTANTVTTVTQTHLKLQDVHHNRTIRFVQYGCTSKTPVPSRLQIYKLTAVNIMAVNHIDTVNFTHNTALYGGIRVDSL